MRPTSVSVQLLAGNENYEEMPSLKPLVPFDETVIAFFDELSISLMKHPLGREFPDVITFGFFIRKANIKKHMNSYTSLHSSVGRGVSFHIAPSNVPINFAFSLASGLLSGNACIVRVSTKNHVQTELVSVAISSILEKMKFAGLKKYISIVKYQRNSEVTSYFSSLCDVRIIWGGDDTISEIRKSTIPPRSFDITFADRYSFCIIKAAEYLKMQNKNMIANDFYNDTYLFDQNACSSPRLVYWVGSASLVSQAKDEFWLFLHETLMDKKYKIQSMTAINKYRVLCQAAIDYKRVEIPKMADNLISRIELNWLPDNLPENTCSGGSFFEYSDEVPDKILDVISRKFQTLTYIGYTKTELRDIFTGKGALGIDRIVPSGKASEFGFIWDGYDLIKHMSRVVSID